MRLKIYPKIRFCHFFVFLALSSVICRPVHLFNTSCELKVLIKKALIKNLFREKSGGTVAYFHWIAILPLLKLVTSVNKEVKGNIGI